MNKLKLKPSLISSSFALNTSTLLLRNVLLNKSANINTIYQISGQLKEKPDR